MTKPYQELLQTIHANRTKDLCGQQQKIITMYRKKVSKLCECIYHCILDDDVECILEKAVELGLIDIRSATIEDVEQHQEYAGMFGSDSELKEGEAYYEWGEGILLELEKEVNKT